MNRFKKNPYVLMLGSIFLVALVLVGGLAGFAKLSEDNKDTSGFDTFSSCFNMADYINSKTEQNYPYPYPVVDRGFGEDDMAEEPSKSDGDSSNGAGGEEPDYSETNTQVEGVDEADIVKTDGQYIYAIDGNELSIIDVRDAGKPMTVSTVDFRDQPREMYLDGDRLAIHVQEYNFYSSYYPDSGLDLSASHVYLYDISDRSNPEIVEEVAIQGNYYNSRKIDNFIYVINTSYFYNYSQIREEDLERYIPRIVVNYEEDDDFESEPTANCDEISYYGDNVNSFVTITAIPLDDTTVTTKVILGDSSNLYMSRENLYLSTTYTEDSEGKPVVWDDVVDLEDRIAPSEPPRVSTEIFKLSVDGSSIDFAAKGTVPGTVKNQFSFDEYYDHLRVTTTVDDFWGWTSDSKNNLYILDENMNIVGDIEGLAEGERIYSTRFMGDRAYVVTFRQTDPLFVFDLSNPEDPKLLGELKIPGFSEYLHPYDTNHVIGIGKDADPDNGRTEGLKFALFDVTDPSNPKVKSEVIVGEAGSDSAVLRDHKAFLFDKEKELLSLPVYLGGGFDRPLIEVIESNKKTFDSVGVPIEILSSKIGEENMVYEISMDASSIEKFTANVKESIPTAVITISGTTVTITVPSPEFESGFIVYDINLEEGIKESFRVPFASYYYWSNTPRSLFIENNLFMISEGVLKVADLETNQVVGELEL